MRSSTVMTNLGSACFRLLACLLISGVGSLAYSATIDIPGDYPTIQQGMDAAETGDSLLIAPGTYTGEENRNLDFQSKGIAVIGVEGPESTIIDCEGAGRGFIAIDVAVGEILIQGFTVRDASSYYQEFGHGGGILCLYAPVTIRNCVFDGCFADGSGGGIKVDGSRVSVEGCSFNTCVAGFESNGANGGALSISSQAYPTVISDCQVVGCFAYHGGGVGGGGGGIVCSSQGDVSIHGCQIRANWSERSGGGLSFYGSGSFEISDCLITGNKASSDGGGIAANGGATVAIVRTTIAFNLADYVRGGGIYCPGISTVLLDHSILWRNCAYDGGHEAWIESGSSLTLQCSATRQQGLEGDGQIVFVGENVFTNPLFCSPITSCTLAPTEGGVYTLESDSPCAWANNPECGYIGALPVGCGEAASADMELPDLDGIVSVIPNPSTGPVRIDFRHAGERLLAAEIVDIAGRIVRHLFDGSSSSVNTGESSLTWDGRNDQGQLVPAGTYFSRLAVGDRVETRRIVLVR